MTICFDQESTCYGAFRIQLVESEFSQRMTMYKLSYANHNHG